MNNDEQEPQHKGKRSPTPCEMCRIGRIRVSSPIVERSSEDGRGVAVISPVRPPKKSQIRLELDRVEPADYQTTTMTTKTVAGSVPGRGYPPPNGYQDVPKMKSRGPYVMAKDVSYAISPPVEDA